VSIFPTSNFHFNCEPAAAGCSYENTHRRTIRSISMHYTKGLFLLLCTVVRGQGPCDVDQCEDAINGVACFAAMLPSRDFEITFQCVSGHVTAEHPCRICSTWPAVLTDSIQVVGGAETVPSTPLMSPRRSYTDWLRFVLVTGASCSWKNAF
jgi:hypothetical protein